MKKLRLDPEELSVEPFELEAAEKASATVRGNDFSLPQCGSTPADTCDSCGYQATCGETSCDSGYPVCRRCPPAD